MSLNRQPKPKISKKEKLDLSAVASDLDFGTDSVHKDIQSVKAKATSNIPEKVEKHDNAATSNHEVQSKTKKASDSSNPGTDTNGYHRDANGRLFGKHGKPIGRPRKGSEKKVVQKHITCTEEQSERYMRAAAKDGRLFPQFATRAIEEYIKNHNLED